MDRAHPVYVRDEEGNKSPEKHADMCISISSEDTTDVKHEVILALIFDTHP